MTRKQAQRTILRAQNLLDRTAADVPANNDLCFSFPFMNLNEVFLSPPSHSMRRICALTAHIIYSGDDETEFSKKLKF